MRQRRIFRRSTSVDGIKPITPYNYETNESDSRHRALLLGILCLAAFLRFHALAQDLRFQADEALFATFARGAALNGAWMLPGALDKPPLTFYAMALSMSFAARGSTDTLLDFDARQGEFAARVPNVFASIVLVAVIYALAKRLYRRREVAFIAALLMACSPLLVAFSASAFTDILMLLGMTGALWMAASKRPLWAGVWLAVGFASKQQALYYVPLILGLLWLVSDRVYLRQLIYASLRFFLPIIITILLLIIWDSARAQETGLFALAAANNSPTGFVPLNEIPARILLWWQHSGYLLGDPTMTAVLLLLALIACIGHLSRLNALLWGYIAFYSAAHWLIAFNIYDRYLLVILPLSVLLAAWSLFELWRWLAVRANAKFLPTQKLARLVLVALLCFSLLRGVVGSIDSKRAEGRADDSIIDLAAFLNNQTLGAIIYDRWIGWELNYYLGQWTDKRKVYYPTPEILAADSLLQLDPAPRYFVTPIDRPYQAWLDALAGAGFEISEVYDVAPYRVFRLNPSWAESGA